ncbi:MAG: type II toxin-antitoxin system Phd/YefM family antitoxin [Candidatus Rokuibacteriota bacterium]
MPWQLQEAKQKFSQLVQRAVDDGPQVVTRRGEEVVVVLSAKQFRRLARRRPDFRQFLLSAPGLDRLDIRRPKDRARRFEP